MSLTAVWTDCCFRHSAAEILLVACYCLVFDPPTCPTCVTSDVSLRRVYACMQVPADILLFNPGKPWHCTRNSVWSVCKIKTAQGTDSWKSWNMTGNISRLIRSRKGRVSVLPGKNNLMTRRNLSGKPEVGAPHTVGNLKLSKHCCAASVTPQEIPHVLHKKVAPKSLLPASSLHFPHDCSHHLPWWAVEGATLFELGNTFN